MVGSICNKQNKEIKMNKKSISIGKRMFLFSSETPDFAINIRNDEIEIIRKNYSAGNTLGFRKLEYDLSG